MADTALQTGINQISEQEAYEIGLEAYCYFYPMLTMHLTMRQTTNSEAGKRPGFGPPNTFSHIRAYPDANFKTVVRPNFDTLYSSAWLDLTIEPVIVSIPDTNGRYYLLPMLDMWTDVFAAPGWRTSGTSAQDYAIVPKGWIGSLPENILRIEAPTNHGWIIGRIKTDGPDDYEAVHQLQNALSIVPLSQWGKAPHTVPHKIDDSVDMDTPPLEAINKLPAKEYFAMATQLLKCYSPHLTDWGILARMKRVGIEAGKNFDFGNLDSAVANGLNRATKDALNLLIEKTKTMGKPVNGWAMNTDSMGVYGNYYFKRAVVTLVGLGANQAEDAIYPLNFADAEGKPLSAEYDYVLHFEKAELPPAKAFWSVTMYDATGYQVANSIDRFAISSWMPLRKNADDSLDIYIQHKNPGPDKESNWLPAPLSGTLGVTMRLYAPAASALNGDWNPPAIKRIR